MFFVYVSILSLLITFFFTRYGFNLTDQGLILANSKRILNGEIPHVDWISIRPAGSAILHVVDLLIPGPTFLISNYIAVFEVIVYSGLFVAILTNIKITKFSVLNYIYLLIAALINLHTFPISAWHTIDAILFVAIGIYIFHFHKMHILALIIMGLSVVCKQNFILIIPAIYLLLYIQEYKLLYKLYYILYFILPIVGYISIVGIYNISSLKQLIPTNTHSYGLLKYIALGVYHYNSISFILFLIAAILLIFFPRYTFIYIVTLCLILIFNQLRRPSNNNFDWSVAFFVLLFIQNLVQKKYIIWVLLIIGFVVSVSFGYSTPSLIAGNIFIYSIILFGVPKLTYYILLPVVILLFGYSRYYDVYRDKNYEYLKYDLGNINYNLYGIKTNEYMYNYIKGLNQCVNNYHLHNVGIMPYNAGIYPALGINNTLKIDWVTPLEMQNFKLKDIIKHNSYVIFTNVNMDYIYLNGGIYIKERDYKYFDNMKKELEKHSTKVTECYNERFILYKIN